MNTVRSRAYTIFQEKKIDAGMGVDTLGWVDGGATRRKMVGILAGRGRAWGI
jgi:hypothetical protein